MANNPMVVLVVEPEKKPTLKVLDGSLESMQETVNGYIEAVYPFDDEVAVVLNEEGKFTGELPNRAFYNEEGLLADIIFGTFFVCYAPAASEDFESLPDEFIHKYAEYFNNAERFIRANGSILVQSWDKEPHSYLGVNYQFHEYENSTDIEFSVDVNGGDYETVDWHTVEDGSDESKNIEQVAKEWAGNLAVSRANAVLGVMKDSKVVDEVLVDAKERSDNIGSNEYYKEKDGWFTYYVNVKTGDKKFELGDGDVEIEAPKRDDFSREYIKD